MFMAIDQWGQTFHGLEHPAKDLMEKLGYRSARKMFQDRKDGSIAQTGYVVGPHWCTVYEVKPWEKAA